MNNSNIIDVSESDFESKVVNASDNALIGVEAIGPSNPKGKVFQT